MTIGENDPILAEIAAPETEITATPESVEPETPETEVVEKTPEKVFTQEDMDRVIAKEKAKVERRVRRELAAQQQQPQQPVSNDPITPEQFETYEEYAEVLAERKAHELIQQRQAQEQRQQIELTYAERVEQAMEKYDDFEQIVQNPKLRITNEMAETIKASEVGPDVAYWLGSNPKEADRISRLSPLQQAREIGKIEAKITAEPPAKKTTSAPAPINPVTTRTATNPTYDTTDPRSIKSMNTSEWIEAERQRQIRKMQSQR